MRRVVLCGTLCLLGTSVCVAGKPTNEFLLVLEQKGRKGYVVVEKGQVVVGDGGPGCVWFVDGTRLKSKATGRYLVYDPAGKDGKVFLADKPGDKAYWMVDTPGRQRGDEGDRGDIQAAVGPMRGWFLCEESGRIVLRKHPSRKVQVRRIWT